MAIIKDHTAEAEIFLDENKILHIVYLNTPQRNANLGIIGKVLVEIRKLVRESGKETINVFVDTRLNKRQYRFFSARERATAKDIIQMKELANWAIVGDTPFMKVAANFISVAAGKKLHWFTDEKKAYEWLLSKQ